MFVSEDAAMHHELRKPGTSARGPNEMQQSKAAPANASAKAGHGHADRGAAMTGHAVVIVGGGPTGLMLAGELALAGVDVAIVERRASQDVTGTRAGGLHARSIEVLDQRGIADRFLTQGQVAQIVGFAWKPLAISDFPTGTIMCSR